MRTCILILILAAIAPAQSHYGYGFVGFSGSPDTDAYTNWQGNFFHAGFGAQGRVARRWTVGGEAGAISSIDNQYGRSTLLVSGGPEFHAYTSSKADVFLTGGGSNIGTGGNALMWFYGAGVNYWFARRVGFRTEFRDHIWPSEGTQVRFTGIRFGVTLR